MTLWFQPFVETKDKESVMKAVRIEPVGPEGQELLIDITCDCGQNGLRNKATNETSFKHSLYIGGGDSKIVRLVCDGCKKEYGLRPQLTHAHVFEIPHP